MLALSAVPGQTPSRAQEAGADAVLNLATPANVRIFRDLAYVDQAGPRQKLDLYLPFPLPAKPLPLIVYLHGGGWRKGSKADGRPLAFRMVAQGYAVACISYRLSVEAQFPAQLEDCKTAVRWLRGHAERYRLDPEHVGVVGVSAGGHLAALLGVTHLVRLFDNNLNPNQSSSVQAVCDFFGPVDLVQLYEASQKLHTPQADEVVKLLGGDPRVLTEAARSANPLTYIEDNVPAFFIIHGTDDTVVPPEQSRLLYDALRKQGISAHLHLIHGAGHTGPAFIAPDVNAMVDDFFASILKGEPPKLGQVVNTVTESSAVRN